MVTKLIISGKRCAGKSTLFWNIQKYLNWPVFSLSHFLRDFIRTKGLSPEEVEQLSEQVSREVDERIQSLLVSPYPVIIENRMLGFVLPDSPTIFSVLLYANDTVRVKRSAQREGISEEKAHNRLFKREEKLNQRMQNIYGRDDFYEDTYYNFVIDTSDKTPEQVLDTLTEQLRPLLTM